VRWRPARLAHAETVGPMARGASPRTSGRSALAPVLGTPPSPRRPCAGRVVAVLTAMRVGNGRAERRPLRDGACGPGVCFAYGASTLTPWSSKVEDTAMRTYSPAGKSMGGTNVKVEWTS
jgi:hypothetical protein